MNPTAKAFVNLLLGWTDTGFLSTAYLIGGGTVTSDKWEMYQNVLLMFEGQDKKIYVINPARIIAVHEGHPGDVDPRFKLKGTP